ncbi:hypothetical protein A3A66_03095 [Microgenomates group bacterium RIFCSPLOWO2_01_FULL_46_13]|nr:MAG: hypothetical protein A2783_04910 [Microgenomates group bacterium RIFCSPHIGHO2_01_FULL_45_11]OGV94141.1 MAG: hypothetical protein A3A66_03095 [Microgenomates group bacterium RIFCSPLOWO2_01_FULL_46_13]
MKGLHIVAFTLVVIGALNWGLVGLFDFNLVEALFGLRSGLTQLVYVLVGASAIYIFATHQNDCKICAEIMGGKKKK